MSETVLFNLIPSGVTKPVWTQSTRTFNTFPHIFQASHLSCTGVLSVFTPLTFSVHLLSLLAPGQVMNETEQYLQQLLLRAVAVLPQWRVQVQKCKAIQMVLNLCSPSVTEKCLIAEAWCPVNQLPALQSGLREGGVRIRTRKTPSSAEECNREEARTTAGEYIYIYI